MPLYENVLDVCSKYNEETIYSATFTKYVALAKHVGNMSVRDKRAAFQIMRSAPNANHNTFMPHWCITCGEFAVWQILS